MGRRPRRAARAVLRVRERVSGPLRHRGGGQCLLQRGGARFRQTRALVRGEHLPCRRHLRLSAPSPSRRGAPRAWRARSAVRWASSSICRSRSRSRTARRAGAHGATSPRERRGRLDRGRALERRAPRRVLFAEGQRSPKKTHSFQTDISDKCSLHFITPPRRRAFFPTSGTLSATCPQSDAVARAQRAAGPPS